MRRTRKTRTYGHRATTLYTREEPQGFVGREVDYEIMGTVTPGIRGSFDHPPDCGEVEIMEVVRIDPDTAQHTNLPPGAWPFTDEEMDLLSQRLASTVEEDWPDEPEPPPREDD